MLTKIERIQKDLETLATFTSTPGKGVTRSSYSKEDTMAKEYLLSEMKKLNLQIYEDGVGTIFGRKEGTLKSWGIWQITVSAVVMGGRLRVMAGPM